MTATMHTPGPWKVGTLRKSGHTRSVTILPPVVVSSFGAFDADLEANARLIAAAPELLAALQAIARTSCHIEEGNQGPLRAWSECCAIARAAIAKATGGAQ